MTAAEVMVRMGELAVSADPGEVLVSIGLGSCVGLALVDRRTAFAGLAHIMLPQAPESAPSPAKFADLAVPELVRRIAALGVAPRRLDAVIVGGAQMFSFGPSGPDIGARNVKATRAALGATGIRVAGTATGGNRGRTVRVHVGDGLVTVREAGGRDESLLAPRHAAVGGRS